MPDPSGESSPSNRPSSDPPAGGPDTPSRNWAETPLPNLGSRVVTSRLARPMALGFAVTLGALIALALALALTNLSTVLIYIVLALFLSLGLNPVVLSLEKRGVARGWAIVIVSVGAVLVVIGVLSVIIPLVVQQLVTLVRSLPSAVDEFLRSDLYLGVEQRFGDGLSAAIEQFEALLVDPGTLASIGGGVLNVSFGILGGLSGALIVVVLTLYFLASLNSMKQGFYRLAPAWSRPQVSDLTERITSSVGDYLKGMIILAFFNSVYSFLLHLVLGLPFALLMSFVAFFITIIPLVGPALFWITATVIALFTSPFLALLFFVLYFIYMEIEAYFLTPMVMKRAIHVPGPLVVIGALVGGTLLGLLGALVAVPVTASILLIIKEVLIPRQDAKLVREVD